MRDHPTDNFDSDAFVALMQVSVDGAVDEAGLRQLNDWLRTVPAARRMFVMFWLDAQIMNEMLTDRAINDSLDDLDGALHRQAFRNWPDSSTLLADALEQEQAARQSQLERLKAEQAHLDAETRRQTRLPSFGWAYDDAGRPVRHIVIPRIVAFGTVAAAIAAIVALVVNTVWKQESIVPEPETIVAVPDPLIHVARLVEQVNARWDGASPDSDGGALSGREYVLAEGIALLRFDNEAEVLLQAPCRVKPESPDAIRLSEGTLVGLCKTPRSRGFLVRTPSAEVRDIGTRFGVTIDWRGGTGVYVAEGEVQIRSNAGVYRTLRSNEQAGISHDGHIDPHVDIDSGQFVYSIEDWQYRPQMTGAVRWSPELKLPIRTGSVESDVHVRLLLERAGAAIFGQPRIAIQHPGRYVVGQNSTFEDMPLDSEHADIYLLHYDPVGSRKAGDMLPATGSITFRRPVLGIEVRSLRFQNPIIEYAPGSPVRVNDGLDDGTVSSVSDVVILSADRHTVTFHLNAATSADQMRLFVTPRVVDTANISDSVEERSENP